MSEATPEVTPAAPTAPAAQQQTEATPEPTRSEPVATKSFSQDEVNAILAKQKREAFGDYGDLKAKAARLDQLEEAQKTEQQRHAEAAAKAQREAEEARTEALRYKAAATHGVAADYFDLLGSGDEETITGRAERIGSLVKSHADLTTQVEQLKAENEALRQGKPVPASRPIEALKPGATAEQIEPPVDDSYPPDFLTRRARERMSTN